MQSSNCMSQSCLFNSNSNRKFQSALVMVLCIALATTGCTSQWLNVALADLPALTQMALNIATLVSTVQSGKQLNPGEITAVRNISAEASRDLSLLQGLYNAYKANPDATTLQKIQETITSITGNLPALLQSAHISDPATSARVSAGVTLIMTTVASFESLMPQKARSTSRSAVRIAIPNAKDLKRQWNQQVCGETTACVVR